jgi:phosphoribosyl-dephospho-CoA transferase
MNPAIRPQDLLQIDPCGNGLVSEAHLEPLTTQVLEWLQAAPYVVVRRARLQDGLLPIGIRGPARSDRFAAWLDPAAILSSHPPETLRSNNRSRTLPAFTALALLEQAWDNGNLGLPWGPTGSIGFELASGHPAASQTSDLDLLLRAQERCSLHQLQTIAQIVDSLPCTVDIQIETPAGAFALQDYLASPDKLLLRTSDGPKLVNLD